MAYTPPRTWVANEVASAALLNTHLRDNMLETAVAKVTTAGDQVYATGPNALARIAQGAITGGAINWKYVEKTSDESLNTSVTLQNDNELLLALAANEIWIVEFGLVVYSASATPDFKFSFTVPAACVGGYTAAYVNAASANTVSQGVTMTTVANVGIAAAGYHPITIQVYVANAGTAGNLQLQWAQNTSNGTDVTVKAGSFLRAIKVA